MSSTAVFTSFGDFSSFNFLFKMFIRTIENIRGKLMRVCVSFSKIIELGQKIFRMQKNGGVWVEPNFFFSQKPIIYFPRLAIPNGIHRGSISILDRAIEPLFKNKKFSLYWWSIISCVKCSKSLKRL